MKILHLNNIAGLPMVIAKEQRRQGHEVDVLDLHKQAFDYGGNGTTISLSERLLLPFKHYDVFHLHSASCYPRYLDIHLHKLLKNKVLYHHHGSDVRFTVCPAQKWNKIHLVSNPDLLKWCEKAVYLPYPIENLKWRAENEDFKAIQEFHALKQKDFLEMLVNTRFKLWDIPSYLLKSGSYSRLQAESLGLEIYEAPRYPNEVKSYVKILDYVYGHLVM